MSIHNLPRRSKPIALVDERIGRTAGRPSDGSNTTARQDIVILEAAADAIMLVTQRLNPQSEDFQRAVPRFKAEFARLVPDYTPAEMSMALSMYLGERERQLAILTTLNRLAGRSGAEFLPPGTLRAIVEQAAEAGDAEAMKLLASGRTDPFFSLSPGRLLRR
jgi:hypothetical protein